MNILIADDNEDTRYILSKILTAAGHQVDLAENGKIALQLARRSVPEFIVSDILMPEMDGYQLCREVRGDEVLRDIPFIFYTATYTDAKDEQLALALGADKFIRKPLDGQDFVEAIQEVTRITADEENRPVQAGLDKESDFLRLYNQRLVHKLEKKLADLERESAARLQVESELRAVVEAVPDTIFRMSRAGEFLDFRAAEGFAPCVQVQEFLGRTVNEVLPEEVACLTMENIEKALSSGRTVTYEYQLNAAGLTGDYEARCAPVEGGDVIAFIRDITVERRALRDLSASEERYRALVESSADHIFLLDLDGICQSSNHECAGCGVHFDGGIVGRHMKEFLPANEEKKFHDNFNLVVATGRSISFEHQAVSAGKVCWHLDTLYPVMDNGILVGVGGVCRDITAYKAAEAALRASEIKYRGLFENSPDGIAVTTVDGRIIEANRAFLEIYGYSRQEIMTLHAKELYENPDDRNVLLAKLQSSHVVRGFQAQRRRKDGSIIESVASAVARRNDQGEIETIQSITRDVTEVRNLQKQLIQAQKMESVGLLAGGVAHDFNNMLSIMTGYAGLIAEMTKQDDDLQEYVGQILQAGNRAAGITRQLLGFARKQAIAPKILDLNETVEQTLKMLRRLIGENISLIWRPASVWQVKVDPAQIDQILVNICVNARDAIGGVGHIVIETDNMTFDEVYCSVYPHFVPGEYVVLAVSDDGRGMPMEEKEKIFEPFFTTKDIGEGTGLGLATVYGIVKQNNGYINVYSEPGQGTVFKIYLPRHDAPNDLSPSPREKHIARGMGETILVVEDEVSILKLIGKQLENLGYSVITANRPKDALHLAKERKGLIDLLVTDLVMPEMNGRDLADELVAINPNLKCLFMSGYSSAIIGNHGILLEGIAFIQKPFATEDLAEKIRLLLTSKTAAGR